MSISEDALDSLLSTLEKEQEKFDKEQAESMAVMRGINAESRQRREERRHREFEQLRQLDTMLTSRQAAEPLREVCSGFGEDCRQFSDCQGVPSGGSVTSGIHERIIEAPREGCRSETEGGRTSGEGSAGTLLRNMGKGSEGISSLVAFPEIGRHLQRETSGSNDGNSYFTSSSSNLGPIGGRYKELDRPPSAGRIGAWIVGVGFFIVLVSMLFSFLVDR